MNKKIIAILLVFTLVITCFVACKRHDYETTKVGNMDVLLYTDKDGNTVINEDNQIVAVVTDRDGEIITYENGEDQTYLVQIPGSYVGDGYIQAKNFKMTILKGWEGTENSTLEKKGTDGKCFIQFTKTYVLKDNEKFSEIFAETDKANNQVKDAFNDPAKMKELIKQNPDFAKYEGCEYTIDENTTTFSSKSYPCKTYTHKIIDSKNNVVHYVENYYFLVNKTVYNVSYTCVEGIGYDESFIFSEYLRSEFTFNE